MTAFNSTTSNDGGWRYWLLFGLLVAASVGLSAGLACAMPFAGLAAVAALHYARRDAAAMLAAAWLANQLVGYLLLDYPRIWDSFAWGFALGAAVIASSSTASWLARWLVASGPAVAAVAALVGAFVAFEGVLALAATILPGSWDAFAPWLVARIFAVNALAFAGLFVLYRVATMAGLAAPSRRVAALPA